MSITTRYPLLASKCRQLPNLNQISNYSSKTTFVSRVNVIGIPMGKGQRKVGVENGPTAIRATNFIKVLEEELGALVTDHGNIQMPNETKEAVFKNIRNPEFVGSACQQISKTLRSLIKDDQLCITLGGDHSIAIGTIHAHTQVNPNACVIWVDAHADINTVPTSNSGNMHGMPMSFHLHELNKYNAYIPGFDWVKPSLMGKDVVYIGLRDVEPLERLLLDKCGIKVFAMQDIDRLGIVEVAHRALDAVNPNRNRPIHTSFDIDAYDVSVAPSTGTSVPGGLTLREGLTLAEEIFKTGQLRALDICEVNPRIGNTADQEKTAFAAKQTILAFCGNCRGGNLPLKCKEIPEE